MKNQVWSQDSKLEPVSGKFREGEMNPAAVVCQG